MIEKFVNGTNFEILDMIPVGKTNIIRELYILKCDLETVLPTFQASMTFEDMMLVEDRVYEVV